MDCPACKNAMVTFELAEVEVDYCTDCAGIWLDAGELELLLGDIEQSEHLLASFKIDRNSTEKPRKCPICLKKMHKVIVGLAEPALLIDKCPRGHGLWFDKGELQQVLKTDAFDTGNKLARLLADIFADRQTPHCSD